VAREGVRPDQAAGGPGAAPPVRPEQHFTQPPPRYSEASLVKALEEEDIGRPSTYATIVGTITRREYVEREKGRLTPTALGMAVNRCLVASFPEVFDVKFTSGMEDELDGIEEGRQEWHRVVRDLWEPLERDLARVQTSARSCDEVTDKPCPKCGKPLRMRFNRRGAYFACTGYPACKHTEPVEGPEPPVPIPGTCPKCGAGLVLRQGPFGRYVACATRPACAFTRPHTIGIACLECGTGELAEQLSKRGKTFYSCTNYPKCRFAVFDPPVRQPCPLCGAPFLVERTTRRGTTRRCARPGCGYRSGIEPEPAGA